jgi:hypothetical protein
MSELAAELSRGAVLREDTGEWVKDQARRLMRAIEPLCADVVRVSEGDRSDEATAWRTLLASVRGVLPESRDSSTYGAIPIDSTRSAMSAKELIALATAAYGQDWKMPLSQAIGYSREMLWRYETARSVMPGQTAEAIRRNCRARIAQRIDELRRALQPFDRVA